MNTNTNKTKTTVIALATALVLALGGTMAWLVSADGPVTNTFDPNKVIVDLTETTGEDYNIIPGTEEAKDPKISAEADVPAYVYAIVTDKTQGLVTYEIADGWTELEGCTEPVTAKDRDGNEITIDPQANGVKVYYREVEGTNDNDEFGPWSVLKNDMVSYSADLTNEQLAAAEDPIQLIFNAYAAQKSPFNDPAKAWNLDYVKVTGVSVAPTTLSMEVGGEDQQLAATVAPENAAVKGVTWTSSDETVATVDSTGKVHAVGAGTATITAETVDKTNNGKGFTATCEVTVTEPQTVTGNIKLAMQLHTASASSVEFWPAMGTHEYGSKCSGEHCIHNDSWEEIKAHPENYQQCITAGCTKTVTIDETSNSAIFNGSHGSEAGMLNYNELNSEACMWSSTGSNSNPTYPDTLAAIKAGSDIPSGATMKLLSMADLGDPALYTPDSSRVIYDSTGNADDWWLSDPNPNVNNDAYIVYFDGYINDYDLVNYDLYGIAPGFSY